MATPVLGIYDVDISCDGARVMLAPLVFEAFDVLSYIAITTVVEVKLLKGPGIVQHRSPALYRNHIELFEYTTWMKSTAKRLL